VIVGGGATGSVGGAVAQELAARGESIRIIVRDPERAPNLPGAEVADFVHGRPHGATEAVLRDSGLPSVSLRNSMYSDEMGSWFDQEGRTTGPGGDGRVLFSYRPGIAQAIAVPLAEPAHDDRESVTSTGTESVTLSELAEIATERTGGRYRYEPLPRDDWIAASRALGRPDWSIEAGISYFDGVAQGEADVASNDYEELTGRSPAPIGELIDRFRSRMPLT